MLKKSSLILLLLTSCNAARLEFPSEWHTPLIAEITLEDPSCYLWWQAFGDCLLNELIENNCAKPDIARSYIELRGYQARLAILERQIIAQNTTISLNEGLLSTINQNENVSSLFTLLAQKSELQLAIDRTIFHLSTLTLEPIECLYDRLCPQPLFNLPCYLPVGTPCDIARKIKCPQMFSVFEKVEGALAGLKAEQEAVSYLDNVKRLKAENYQLTKDLNEQGLKSDAKLQAAYLELLSAEDALIQAKVKLLIEYVNLYEAQGA